LLALAFGGERKGARGERIKKLNVGWRFRGKSVVFLVLAEGEEAFRETDKRLKGVLVQRVLLSL